MENLVRDLDFWRPNLSRLLLSWEIQDLKFIPIRMLTYVREAAAPKPLCSS